MAKCPGRETGAAGTRLRYWVVSASLVLGQLGWPGLADAQTADKQVLVLYSTRRDAQLSIVGERELPGILAGNNARAVEYYSEFMDLRMFPEPTNSAFREFLGIKYQGVRFDLVIAIQDAALDFFSAHRERLFMDTPLVFLTNNPSRPRPPDATGLSHERDFADTVTFIRELQPEVRNVFVVTGAAAGDRAYETVVRRQLGPVTSGLNVTYLSGLPAAELESRLATLPGGSAVYYVLVSEDGAGQKLHPLDYIDRVAAAANAPTYCWVDSALDHGIVGGSLYRQAEVIRSVGRLARRVLDGESVADIPIAVLQPNAREVDWRQLRRWGIGEARIPSGTAVRFRELSIWDRYGRYILAALGLFIIQTTLIAGLLLQRRRRRKAEGELRTRESELRGSYDRIRDLGSRLLRAQDSERARIARELHDDISQRMLLLTLELEALDHGDSERPHAGEALAVARDIARSLHELSHRLHPTTLRLIGLVNALERLCVELSRTGRSITFAHQNVPAKLTPDVSLCIFRVVQEALQNALKHSGASQIAVRLSGGSDGLTVTIADDGVGFDANASRGSGVGLLSMIERLEALGGSLDVSSTPGGGTRLTAAVPVHGSDR